MHNTFLIFSLIAASATNITRADFAPDSTTDEPTSITADIQPDQPIEEPQENGLLLIEEQEPTISTETPEEPALDQDQMADALIIDEAQAPNITDAEHSTEYTDTAPQEPVEDFADQELQPSSDMEEMIAIESEEPLTVDEEDVEVDISVENTDAPAAADTQPAAARTQSSAPAIEETKSITRMVQVTNGVTTEMTQYHHWSGTYTPEFSIKVNEKVVQPGQTAQIEVTNDQVAVAYHAQFPYRRNSAETINCTVAQNNATIMFDWNKEPRIIIV